MKKQSGNHTHQPETNLLPANGAGLSRATLLFRRLRAALEGTARRQFRYEDLAELIGEPKSTLCNWNNGDGQPAPEALLRLFELLPAAERNQIHGEFPFCRQYPTLAHPRISHDPVAVSYLRTVLRNEKGITMVCGDRDILDTFVATAMAHSFVLSVAHRGQIAGLDVHAPDWFVAVPGVTYLNNAEHPGRIRAEAEKIWPEFSASRRRIVLLNGTWAPAPELKLKTCELAETCHVIVTNIMRAKDSRLPTLPSPARLVLVAPDGRESDRIRIEVQFL
jgi:hypothetical protein